MIWLWGFFIVGLTVAATCVFLLAMDLNARRVIATLNEARSSVGMHKRAVSADLQEKK